jgi:competence protein ComEC
VPRVVALDVGQGDAVLVQGARGALLVDGGTALPGGGDLGRAVVVPALAALGVRRLDVVAASHADLDHRGGLASVIGGVAVGELWLPHGGVADPGFASVVALARERGVLVRERGAGDPVAAVGDLAVESLWPPRDEGETRSDNDRSLVLRVVVAGTRVLLTGDLEAGAEAALAARADLRAEVLKLAHHGSRTSSTPAFLRAVGAEVAIASAPCLGRFRMPHPEVAGRVARGATSLWWTGRDGAVFVGLARPRTAVGLAGTRVVGERWTCAGPSGGATVARGEVETWRTR